MRSCDALPYYDKQVERKVAVVTGGNKGVGRQTALRLYMHGFVVYVCGRHGQKIQKTVQELTLRAEKQLRDMENQDAKIVTSRNGTPVPERHSGSFHYLQMDLSDLQSVVRATQYLKETEDHVDVLVAAAEVVAIPFARSKDGFELQLQVNFLAHLLLAIELLPLLRVCQGRVINISSMAHYLQIRHWPLSQSWKRSPDFLFTWMRYAISKTAQIQTSKIMAIKNPDVMCLSVNPGLLMDTNLFSYWTRLPIVGIFFWVVFQLVSYFFSVTLEQGSEAVLYCALSTELSLEKDNGRSYTTNGKESQCSYIANNLDNATSAWIWSVHELGKRNLTI